MEKKAVSGIMLTLLIIGVITSVFHIQPAKAELGAWTRDDGLISFHKIQGDTNNANRGYTQWPSIENWLMRANGSGLTNRLTIRAMDDFRASLSPPYRWILPNKTQWNEFAYVDGDSAELVVGASDKVQSNCCELADYLLENRGKLIDTVSMGDETRAMVADVPLSNLDSFVSEVETTGLARYIEPNIRYQISYVPNDPEWPKQWGPAKIEAEYAWNITIGNPSVLVAVVDTGIDRSHPDLAANYVPLGYDWINNEPNPVDDNGHGTHVAGIIAAVINNGIGIAGLAQVRIMAEKVMDASGSGSTSDVAHGIVHAVDQGAKIINLSLGSNVRSELLHEAVKYAHDHGALVVAAAGNDATNAKSYPAAYDEVVAVAATDQHDREASFSNWGDWIKLSAPGVGIYSTMPTYHVTLNDYGYAMNYDYLSGTSMACPCAVGVAALIWSEFPNMTRDQVWAQLQCCADDLGAPGFDVYYGYGRINARRSVEQGPAKHDVLILNWKTPSYIRLGSVATINTTVLNMGMNDESNVTVQLLINSSVVDTATVGFLRSGSSTSVSCPWKPTIKGMFNVTSYVMPLTGQTIIHDSALSTEVDVRVPQVIKVPDNYDGIQKAIDAAFEGDTVFVASGTYYENVWINKEDLTLVGENQSNTIIDGQRRADVVDVVADGVTISGFTLRNSESSLYYAGIFVFGAKRVMISEVTTLDNYHGIFLESVVSATLRNDNMTCNTCNFGVDGEGLGEFVHDIDTSNTVDGKPIYYWVNEHNKQVPSSAGYVALVNSTNIVVKDLNLTKNFEGVLFAYTTYSSIENVNASHDYFGTYLAYSHSNMLSSNIATNDYNGVCLYESESNNVDENTLMNNNEGLYLCCSKNNTVDFSKLLNNIWGLHIEKSDSNVISSNEASNNIYGLLLEKSSHNILRNNNMTINRYNFGVEGDHLSYFIQDIDASNVVNGKPVYYWVNQKDKEIPADAGYVAIINSTNIAIRDLNLTNNINGVLLAFTAESIIENVNAINNALDICLYRSSDDTIVFNTVASKGGYGVELINSSNNAISHNVFTNNYIGIGLWSSAENNTINANTVLNGTYGGVGVYLDGSSNNSIGSNTITNNYDGIILYGSSWNTFRNNNMNNNTYNFGVYGTSLLHFVNDVDPSNTVNRRPIYYWINQHDKQVPTNAGYVAVVNSTGITVKDLKLWNNEQGVLFAYTTDSKIMNVTVSNDWLGIYLWSSDTDVVSGNNSTDNDNGIYLWSSDSNVMSENNLTDNWYGIYLHYSDNNTIARNIATDSDIGILTTASRRNYINGNVALRNIVGIYLYAYSTDNIVISNKVTGGERSLVGICLTTATSNVISENVVSDNQFFIGAGISLEWSSNDNTITRNTITNNWYGLVTGYWGVWGLKDQDNNNTIYRNNIIENTQQVLSLNSINSWDNGYPSGGNYWSDYAGTDLCRGPYQNVTGSDGIGDTPCIIDENNRDRYPLMKPFGLPVVGWDWSPPMPRATKTVRFNASSSTPNIGTIVSYTWNFGDGNVTTTTNPIITHTYTDPRYYNVTLTVLNSVDLSGSITKTVKIASLADINMDGKVDIRDLAMVCGAFGSYPDHPRWNAACDISGDNRIDIYDVAYVAGHFGWHDP
jgi:parallel beta-helix repeat protein